MILSSILFALAAISGIAAYVVYVRDILADTVAPNRWSWLIWGFAMAVEAVTYEAVSQDLFKSGMFFIGSALCIGTTMLIWRKAKWEAPHWTEITSLIISLVALFLWLNFSLTLWAYWLMIVVVPISFLPTWRSSIRHPEHEGSLAWVLWALGDFLTLLVILSRYTGIQDLLIVLVEVLCQLTVLVLVRKRKR
jgi:hypothetical protein